MSISPVLIIPSAMDAQPQEAQPHPAPEPVTAVAKSSQPDSGNSPKQESEHLPASTQPFELPGDEVQVQRDAETNGEVVIKYLDHSGSVILQVPSSQMLGLTRSIEQDLEQEAKARTDAGQHASREGGNKHGD
jgi:hypothetical protein